MRVSSQDEDDETDAAFWWLDRPRLQPWREFDKAAREAFLECIRGGVMSRDKAAKLTGVHPSTAKAWIAKGKRTVYSDDDYQYRLFYLQLQRAEAERASVAETTLLNAARTDYRAADLLARRQEAAAVAEYRKRAAAAEAAIKEQQARMAKLQADLVERKLRVVNGRFVFPQEALDVANEAERAALQSLFERRGLVRVEPQDVEDEMEQTRDPVEDAELEELERRWGLGGPEGGG